MFSKQTKKHSHEKGKELTEMKLFVCTVMETLRDFDNRLTGQLNTVDSFGKMIDLSQLNFSVQELKILAYNLNVITTPNIFYGMDFNQDVTKFH